MQLKRKQKFGKYIIEKRLGEGGFSDVYKALDTIEGVHVALKIPLGRFMDDEALEDFRKEARMAARLDHPHILPLKNAAFIGENFVIAYPLGEGTLDQEMERPLPLKKILDLSQQMLEAIAYAHEHKVIHCDIKPENFIRFPGGRYRLTDFGIAKICARTMTASSSGTVGYIAPEQAMGKPSYCSDVFAVGLIIYQMLTRELPEWPYRWPLPGWERLRGKVHPEFLSFLRKAIEVDERKRYKNGGQMLAAFNRVKGKALRYNTAKRRGKRKTTTRDWKQIRLKEFQRRYGRRFELHATCGKCGGPLSETFQNCPWCSAKRKRYAGPTRFPRQCPRCHRGMKADWRFCPWCFGEGFAADESRFYSDRRYEAKCSSCKKPLMPYMQYCPWCRAKVTRKWKVPDSERKCPRCGWGIYGEFWEHCPWCGRGLAK